MKNLGKALASLLLVGVLSVGVAAETASARYDRNIESRVSQELTKKKEFRNLQASVEDGIVTLTGSVDIYQQKLDAAKKVRKLDMQGKLPGFYHLYVGEEAVAVGACSAINQDDYITSTHRGHGHCIAKGADMKRMMAEMTRRARLDRFTPFMASAAFKACPRRSARR